MRQVVDLHDLFVPIHGELRLHKFGRVGRRTQNQTIDLFATAPILHFLAEGFDGIKRFQVAHHGRVGILSVGGEFGLQCGNVVSGDDDVILATFDEGFGSHETWALAGSGEDDQLCK